MSMPLPTPGAMISFDPPEFQLPPALLHKAAVLRDDMSYRQMLKEVRLPALGSILPMRACMDKQRD